MADDGTDAATAEPAKGRPMPRPPGAARPRSPQPPKQRGTDLEPGRSKGQLRRRSFTWLSLAGFFAVLSGCTAYFFFPRTLREKKTTFKVGYPSDFAFGVDDRFQKDYRVWVVRDASEIYVILAICTHLGCTPDWKSSENKFKCPCHGSGYTSDGVNFEGPAPRPMDRCHVEIAPDGQILVDKLRTYKQAGGGWDKPGAKLSV